MTKFIYSWILIKKKNYPAVTGNKAFIVFPQYMV